MGPAHQGATVHAEAGIDAPPIAVWEAWALPEWITQWYADSAHGALRPEAPAVWGFEHFGVSFELTTYEARPGEYLLFGAEMPDGPAILHELQLTPDGDGTRVALTYSGILEGAGHVETLQGCISGWEMALAQLKHWMEHYPGEERVHLMSIRPAEFEYADLQPFYETGPGLAAWLATEFEGVVEPFEMDDEIHVLLRDDGALSGRVLARTAREVLLEWREARGVLGLKCFGQGPESRMVALDFSAWSLPGGDLAAAQAILDGATERLLQSIA